MRRTCVLNESIELWENQMEHARQGGYDIARKGLRQ